MAPSTPEADAHFALVEKLDINSIPKPFRNAYWKPNQRRNKNIKAILSDSIRKEASMLPTQDNSGAVTPFADAESATSTDGEATPAVGAVIPQPNLAQASRNLSKLVLERNMRANGVGGVGAPTATYTNIESAPSLVCKRRYCDITGLSAPYNDPKTRLRYHDKEVFGVIRTLGQGVAEQYLEARGAHTVLR